MKTFEDFWKETWVMTEQTNSTIPSFMESVIKEFAKQSWYASQNELMKQIEVSPSFRLKEELDKSLLRC